MAARLPSLRPERVIRALERCGLEVARQTGSHVMLWKPGLARPVVIARHNRALAPGAVASILTQADVTVEAFLQAL